jgi:hypothetical protein
MEAIKKGKFAHDKVPLHTLTILGSVLCVSLTPLEQGVLEVKQGYKAFTS